MKCTQCTGTMRDTGNTINFKESGPDYPIYTCKECDWLGLLVSGVITELESVVTELRE